MIMMSLNQTPELATIPALAPFSSAIWVNATKIGPSKIANAIPNNNP